MVRLADLASMVIISERAPSVTHGRHGRLHAPLASRMVAEGSGALPDALAARAQVLDSQSPPATRLKKSHGMHHGALHIICVGKSIPEEGLVGIVTMRSTIAVKKRSR